MAAGTEKSGGRRGIPWRMIGWGGATLILLLPWVAKAPWTLFDFLLLGAFLGGTGLVLELAASRSGNVYYRAGAGVAVAAAFLLIAVNGAVGFLGNEDNVANLMFFGVIATAFLGSVFARFRPAGMAWAMFAAAAGQILAGVIGLAGGLGLPGYDGLYEASLGTSLFAALWLVSAGLFRMAAPAAERDSNKG
jgi:hypothetical protein